MSERVIPPAGGNEPTPLPGGWEAEAAEYALGILPEAQRDRFEARLARDPDLRQDVIAWTEYFSTLTDDIPEATPPAPVWRRIEMEAIGAPPPIWRQVMPYVIGAVAGAALSWAVFMSGLLTPGSAVLRGTFEAADGAAPYSARFDPAGGVLAVDVAEGTEAVSEAPRQVWLRPFAEAEPIFLGVLGANGLVVGLPPLLAERMGAAQFEITEAGAQDQGQGPVVAVLPAGNMR